MSNSSLQLSGIHKSFLLIAVLGAIIWLGGSVLRAAIAFDLMIPGTLDFSPGVDAAAIRQSIRLFAMTGFYTMSGYIAAFLGFSVVFAALRRHWKRRGWLVAAAFLFYLYAPVEVWQMYFDGKLLQLTTDAALSFSLSDAQDLLLRRLTLQENLQGLSLLAILAYFTSVLFLVFRPLEKGHKGDPAKIAQNVSRESDD